MLLSNSLGRFALGLSLNDRRIVVFKTNFWTAKDVLCEQQLVSACSNCVIGKRVELSGVVWARSALLNIRNRRKRVLSSKASGSCVLALYFSR